MQLVGRKTVFAGNLLVKKQFSLDGLKENGVNKKNTQVRNSEAPSSHCMFHDFNKMNKETNIITEESSVSNSDSNASPIVKIQAPPDEHLLSGRVRFE